MILAFLFFSAELTEADCETRKALRGYEGMHPLKIFENLQAVMAILVLFEQFSRKFCLNILTLILSALLNMTHFGHELYQNHQKSLAYFNHLSPLILFLSTKDRVKRGEGTEQCPSNTSHSVRKCSGLGLAWGVRHCWSGFCRAKSTVQVQAPLFKKIQDRNFVPKKKPEYTLLIFFACIYCYYLLGLTTKFLKMTQLKRKL